MKFADLKLAKEASFTNGKNLLFLGFNGELVYRHSRASREQMMVPDSVNSVKDHFQQYIRLVSFSLFHFPL